jgi:hypothetical protein
VRSRDRTTLASTKYGIFPAMSALSRWATATSRTVTDGSSSARAWIAPQPRQTTCASDARNARLATTCRSQRRQAPRSPPRGRAAARACVFAARAKTRSAPRTRARRRRRGRTQGRRSGSRYRAPPGARRARVGHDPGPDCRRRVRCREVADDPEPDRPPFAGGRSAGGGGAGEDSGLKGGRRGHGTSTAWAASKPAAAGSARVRTSVTRGASRPASIHVTSAAIPPI